MKKIYIVIAFLICAFTTSAQIEVSVDTADFACMPLGQASDIHNPIKNTDASNVNVAWRVNVMDLPANGWSVTQICDNLSCIAPISIGSSAVSDVVAPGQETDLKVTYQLTANADAGQGIVVIGCSANGKAVDAIFSGLVCPTSVKTIEENEYALYYYDNTIKLINSSNTTAKSYRIYSVYGDLVATGEISAQLEAIPFEYAPSIYLVQVFDKDDNLMGTQKISNL